MLKTILLITIITVCTKAGSIAITDNDGKTDCQALCKAKTTGQDVASSTIKEGVEAVLCWKAGNACTLKPLTDIASSKIDCGLTLDAAQKCFACESADGKANCADKTYDVTKKADDCHAVCASIDPKLALTNNNVVDADKDQDAVVCVKDTTECKFGENKVTSGKTATCNKVGQKAYQCKAVVKPAANNFVIAKADSTKTCAEECTAAATGKTITTDIAAGTDAVLCTKSDACLLKKLTDVSKNYIDCTATYTTAKYCKTKAASDDGGDTSTASGSSSSGSTLFVFSTILMTFMLLL